jgi:acetoin utilization deacetylase AcuC-like enzyme
MPNPVVVWSPAYEVDIGPHVFPTIKYRLVRERLLGGTEWTDADFVVAEPAEPDVVARVHTSEYLSKVRDDGFDLSERIALEVPFSPAVRTAAETCVGGTLQACRLALRDGVAVHLGGGFHHAFADHGEGFCLLNDVAAAAAAVVAGGEVARVLIVDLDVHQGNGTAAIFAREERVFTLSMHQERNYPAFKPPSDLDLGLADGSADASYLAVLRANLPAVLARHAPGLVIYLAGADPYRGDQLGGLSLTMDGLRDRDRYVLETCRAAGAAVAVTLAGGYAVRRADTVRIHAATVDEARRVATTHPWNGGAGR